MLNFKQGTIYQLNWTFLCDQVLKPAEIKEDAVNTENIFIGDFISNASNKETPIKKISFLNPLYKIGSDTYRFYNDESHKYLEILVDLINVSGEFSKILFGDWMYVESDDAMDFPQTFYHFFICQGLDINVPRISLSHDFSNREYVDKILLEADTAPLSTNERGNRAALIKIRYEKWQNETDAGKIYFMKKKMDQEEWLAEEHKETNVLINKDVGENATILIGLTQLTKEIRIMKNIILIILILMIMYILGRFLK